MVWAALNHANRILRILTKYEDAGVDYIIRDPEKFRNRKVVIAGGGDSALDWAIFLADVASEITLVHRRKAFRGALDSVEKVENLAEKGRLNLITEANVTALEGDTVFTKCNGNYKRLEKVRKYKQTISCRSLD